MVVVILPIAWLYLVRFQFKLPSQIGGMECANLIHEERKKLGPLSLPEWLVVGFVFVSTAIGWTVRKSITIGDLTIPGLQSVFPEVNTDATIAMFSALLLFALPVDIKKREFVLDLPSALKIPWDVLLIIGGGVCLADGFSNSGLSQWIANQMQFLANYPAFVIVLFAVTLVVFLTELTSNTATATIFMPIMGGHRRGYWAAPLSTHDPNMHRRIHGLHAARRNAAQRRRIRFGKSRHPTDGENGLCDEPRRHPIHYDYNIRRDELSHGRSIGRLYLIGR